ncbi:DUF1206 domain-containing protein [Rhodococcus aerolatus]
MSTGSRAKRLADSTALQALARVGLVAYGIVHVLVAWLAMQLVLSGGSDSAASQAGALEELSQQPGGGVLLWVLTLGFVALALWQAGEALRHVDGLGGSGEDRKDSVLGVGGAVVKAVVFLALAVTAGRAATSDASGSGSQEGQTSGVFALPGGRLLVGVAALVVIGVGCYQVHKAVMKGFLDEVDLSDASRTQREAVSTLGTAGGVAKGVAFAVVGGLLGWAAVTFDPSKATGLGGAMATILAAPFGRVLLTLVALGFLAFGGYCFLRARFPDRTS